MAQHIAYDNAELLGDLDHTDSEGRGFKGARGTCGSQLNGKLSLRAENILYRFDGLVGSETEDGFFHQWYHSEGHKENMFDENHTHVGFGFFQSEGDNRIYIATVFGEER